MKFVSNLPNRTAYTLILLGAILLIGIGVYAYNSGGPASFVGHTWDEIICDDNMCVNTTSGEVGIGTMSPGAKLEVSSSSISTPLILKSTATDTGALYFQMGTQSNAENSIISLTSDGGASKNFSIVGYSLGNIGRIKLAADTTYITGNVGIGITNPGATLDVNGDIKATGSVNVGYERITEACTNTAWCRATCPEGEKVLGGECNQGMTGTPQTGFDGSPLVSFGIESGLGQFSNQFGWYCETSQPTDLTAVAVCARVSF